MLQDLDFLSNVCRKPNYNCDFIYIERIDWWPMRKTSESVEWVQQIDGFWKFNQSKWFINKQMFCFSSIAISFNLIPLVEYMDCFLRKERGCSPGWVQRSRVIKKSSKQSRRMLKTSPWNRHKPLFCLKRIHIMHVCAHTRSCAINKAMDG